MSWKNDDGVHIRFGRELAEVKDNGAIVTHVNKAHVVTLNFDSLPAFTADLDNDGTNDGWGADDAYVPAGSFITKVTLIPTASFTAAGAATLTLGLAEKDGSVIDADGIDATIAIAALAAGKAVNCDGALVGGTVALTVDAYLYSTVATGPYTAGAGKLVVEYITT